MRNHYLKSKATLGPSVFSRTIKHPLFGFIVMAGALVAVQFLYMLGDGLISLTVSKAIAQTMIYSIVAMGLSILIGQAGLTSLGTAAFMGLGGYVAGNVLKAFNVPFTLTLLLTVLVGVAIGVVVGFIALRVQGTHLLVVTLALAEILNELYRTPNSFTGGSSGLTRVPYPKLAMFLRLDREGTYFLILAVLFLLVVLTLNIISSPTGRAMAAMRSSSTAAQAMGINILKYKVLAFVIATVYAMIGGALYVCQLQGVSPTSWTMLLSLNILAAVVLGGSSISGTILGTFIIFGLDLAVLKNIKFFQVYSNASVLLSGLLLIIIVLKYPGGLTRLLQSISAGVKKLYATWRVYKYGADEQL